MTIAVANTTNTHSWQYALDRLNDIATAISTKVITVDSNTTSGNGVVNGSFQANIGKFDTILANGNLLTITSNSFFSDTNATVTVGNSTINALMNSTYLSISSINQGNSTVNTFSNSSYVGVANSLVTTLLNRSGFSTGNSTANLVINSSSISINGSLIASAADIVNTQIQSSTTVVDAFAMDTYRGAEYSVTIKNLDANGYQMSKVHVLQGGSDSISAEYGVLYTNNQLGTFTANSNATHSRLYLTLASGISNVQVKAVRSLLPV